MSLHTSVPVDDRVASGHEVGATGAERESDVVLPRVEGHDRQIVLDGVVRVGHASAEA